MLKVYFGAILLVFFVLNVYGENSELEIRPRVGEKNLRKLIEEFRKRMCAEIPKFGLPTMDPLAMDQIELDIDNSLAQLKGIVSEVQVDGLSNFVIDNLKTSLKLTFEFGVTIPKISLKGKLQAKGLLGELFPIDANGTFNFVIDVLKLTTSGGIRFSDINQLFNLKAKPSIKKLTGRIENIVPDPEVNDFINKVLNDYSADLLNALWDDIGQDALTGIEEISKILLQDVSAKDIIAILLGKPVFDESDPEPSCKEQVAF